jgi:LacI family transcriptional regulator
MSIQALAQSLGLSISTVSRALNGYSDVSSSTRERVFDAAKRMNYKPHPVAHRLATGKTGAIALITSIRPGNDHEATFVALMRGVAEVLRQRQLFTMGMSIPMDDNEMSEFERLLSGRLFDGVILTRTRTNDPRVALLQERRVPFVTFGRTVDNAPHAWVDADNTGAFEQATNALMALGHRRIALINGMPHMSFATLREAGFRRAIEAAGLSEAQCPVHYTGLTAESGEHVAEQLLQLKTPPTAILCCTDAVALGAMAAIKKAGLKPGVDVSVMGYGNTEVGPFADPPLATIDHAVIDNGRHLAELLLQVMNGESVHNLFVLEEPHIIPRASMGPASA